ncbi:MAG: hypothetical protein RL681_552 [Candidatus Parcubacteria bacterium]|jgi:SHS2 domain-containing protein
MPHNIIDRTAGTIRIHIEAKTPEELFMEAVRGLMDLMRPEADPGVAVAERELAIHAPDQTSLIVDFLKEIITGSYARKEAVQDVTIRYLTGDSIECDVRTIPAISFGEELKGVSYREVNVHKRPDGMWETSIIFDV